MIAISILGTTLKPFKGSYKHVGSLFPSPGDGSTLPPGQVAFLTPLLESAKVASADDMDLGQEWLFYLFGKEPKKNGQTILCNAAILPLQTKDDAASQWEIVDTFVKSAPLMTAVASSGVSWPPKTQLSGQQSRGKQSESHKTSTGQTRSLP